MERLFNEQDRFFEALDVEPPVSVPPGEASGSAILSSFCDEEGVGHSTFAFDEPVADALFRERYHHTLILSVDREMSRRREERGAAVGGALLRIQQGRASVCWVPREEADQLKRSYHYAQAVDELKVAYIEALNRANLGKLFEAPDDLSGVFLPCPAESYFASRPRVLVVGQETRGWRNASCSLRNTGLVNEAGVAASMLRAQQFSAHGARRSKFMQFYRKVSSEVGAGANDAAVWSNQFCLSFKSGSPLRMPRKVFGELKALSYELLRAQLRILHPDVVIFTTGPARDRYLKECFPEYVTVEVLEPRRLWHFKIGNVHCLRTSHPRWLRGAEYLDRAVELAKSLPDRLVESGAASVGQEETPC